MNVVRRHAGRIIYRKAGIEHGREDFSIDVRPDGRTIRAYCEMVEGDLTRDASWSLDAEFRPVEGHVRVVMDGKPVGSAFYCFDAEATQCEALTAGMGRVSQNLPGRADYLGLHALIGDGMIGLARGTDNPGEVRHIRSVTCSYDIKGESGLVALPISIAVNYVGPDRISVPAGTFDAEHYELQWNPKWPPAKLWVTREDSVALRLSWDVSGLVSELETYGVTTDAVSPQFRT